MGKFEIQTLKMNFRFMVFILTKTKRAGGRLPALKCASNIPLCHPHGWPEGNPKYRNKEQGSSLKYTINGKKPHA